MLKKYPARTFVLIGALLALLALCTVAIADFNVQRGGGQVRVAPDGAIQIIPRSGKSTTVVGSLNFCADAGSTDSYACAPNPVLTAYIAGQVVWFKANTANTGAATLNLNALGAKTIKKAAGGITTDLATNDIRGGQYVAVIYDGTNFQMLSTAGSVDGGGDVVGPGSATDSAFTQFDGTTGKLLKSGVTLDTDVALAGDSDIRIPSQKAAKAYADTKQLAASKDATGGYVGLTLFKINFKNAADTFTSFFTNANTAARTYTFQDRDGTIADNTDLALKQDALTNPVVGAGASYKVARGVGAITGSGDVVTGLTTVVSVTVTPQDDLDGDTLAGCSATIGNQAGAPAAGSVTIKCWKVTTGGAAGNPTMIAATAAKNVNWIAVGN